VPFLIKFALYLYIGQSNLNNHLLSVDQTTKDKIIFLGSSAVAGNNIPRKTTLTDYFNQLNPRYQVYNLAAPQSNLLDANVILNIFKNKSPKIVILGIDPTVLFEDQSSLFSQIYSSRANPYKKNEIENFLHNSLLEKIEIYLHEDPVPPTDFQIWWKSLLMEFRYQFWGPLFNKQIYGKNRNTLEDINSETNQSWILIDTFIKTARENNIIPIIFLEPILDSTYPNNEFIAFQKKIKEKSEKLHFKLLDYSSFLPSTHDYFYDFVHLTPNGYLRLATKLGEDLTEDNYIFGKGL
jgi:hypothetical protein